VKKIKLEKIEKKELVVDVIRAVIQVIFTGILFFRSWIGCLVLSPLTIWIMKKQRLKRKEAKKNELRMDFKEVILSISASLHAGYALEQTIPVALEDMRRLYPGEDRVMMRELVWMIRNLQMNVAPEQLFADFAIRSGLEEIRSFSVILLTVRKQGGNLVKISRESAEHISQKIQVQMEIDQVIAGKKMEKNIMICMPYFILIYLQLTNGTYLEPLFHNIYGNCCMLLCLIVIYVADWWADQVVQIPV
jgi:tight adherence protein B